MMSLSLQHCLRLFRRPADGPKNGNDGVSINNAAVPAMTIGGKRNLRRDEDGVAAIEFAFIAPIMIAMLIGIIDISNAVSTNWRMVQLNRTLADLTSQAKVLQDVDINKIVAASSATLGNYGNKPPTMVIASVVVNSAGVPRVCWIESKVPMQVSGTLQFVNGAFPYTVGNTFSELPTAMRVPGTSYIVSRVTMEYAGYVSPDFSMAANWLMYRPRAGFTGGPSGAEQVVRNAETNAC